MKDEVEYIDPGDIRAIFEAIAGEPIGRKGTETETQKEVDMNHSKQYEKIKKRYDKGYVTKEQLHRYVELGAITPEEYEEICGDPYEVES